MSIHSWERVPNPFSMKTPLFPILLTHPPPPLFPVTSKPYPHCSFSWLVSLAEWMIMPHLMLFYLMIWIYTYQALGPWCVFHATRWGLTHNFTGTLIWYHTQKYTQHTQGPVDWHTHLSKYLQQLLFVHSSYLYYIEWIIHWDQKFTFHNVFSVQKLFICKSHICWLDAIKLGSSCDTQIIPIDLV